MQISNPWVLGSNSLGSCKEVDESDLGRPFVFDVNRNHPSVPNHVTKGCHKISASTQQRPCLNDEIWLLFIDDFLINPRIKRAFLQQHAKPLGIEPRLILNIGIIV